MNRELSTEIMIDGEPAALIGRSRISAKSVFGHLDCIDEFVILGARDEWPIGTKVTVCSPKDKLFGTVSTVLAGADQTALHVVHRL